MSHEKGAAFTQHYKNC